MLARASRSVLARVPPTAARAMVTLPAPPGRAEQAPKRPISPHLTIYKFGINMITSVFHRGTGIVLWGGVSASSLLLATTAGGADAVLDFVHSVPLLKSAVKLGIAFPLSYHLLAGVRHLAWDNLVGQEIQTMDRSSYAIIGASSIIALAAAVAESD